ncbi:pilus assembly protein Flp/PilA [Rhizobiales bacterium GAS191]|nr:pilus assembly protein Flp/PilA [Rhizobiales bacterium GAS113]SEE71785.1 pilus assembly protein Flp/PilA [Rhizobiales bacterium GAS191]SEF02556.1 pilus assembly protein Flp/PilA [Rhizobiales bacterium GAS188]
MSWLFQRLLDDETGMLAAFLREDTGATAIEYGFTAALVAAVIVTALTTIGTGLNATFASITNSLGSN